jgi:hypothetical protein
MSADQIEAAAAELSELYTELAGLENQALLLKARFRGLRMKLGDVTTTPAQEPFKRDTMHELANTADVLETAIRLLADGPMSGGEMVPEIYEMLNASPLMASLGSDVVLERARNVAQAYIGRICREPK